MGEEAFMLIFPAGSFLLGGQLICFLMIIFERIPDPFGKTGRRIIA